MNGRKIASKPGMKYNRSKARHDRSHIAANPNNISPKAYQHEIIVPPSTRCFSPTISNPMIDKQFVSTCSYSSQ